MTHSNKLARLKLQQLFVPDVDDAVSAACARADDDVDDDGAEMRTRATNAILAELGIMPEGCCSNNDCFDGC